MRKMNFNVYNTNGNENENYTITLSYLLFTSINLINPIEMEFDGYLYARKNSCNQSCNENSRTKERIKQQLGN